MRPKPIAFPMFVQSICISQVLSSNGWLGGMSRREQMRHKPAGVARDQIGAFADAQAAGFVAHDPAAEPWEVAVQLGNRENLLINKWPLVNAFGLQEFLTVEDNLHVGPFAAQARF